MAGSMWEWFGADALSAPSASMFKSIGEFVLGAQLDPAEVTQRMVELTEAETTTQNNFVPASISPELANLLER